MSLRRGGYEVWCDHGDDDCGAWEALSEWNAKKAASVAVDAGWVKHGRKWFCPQHAARLARKEQ